MFMETEEIKKKFCYVEMASRNILHELVYINMMSISMYENHHQHHHHHAIVVCLLTAASRSFVCTTKLCVYCLCKIYAYKIGDRESRHLFMSCHENSLKEVQFGCFCLSKGMQRF
ncbi:hypothetical protein ACKWTF_012980 [Chironomus riparius]